MSAVRPAAAAPANTPLDSGRDASETSPVLRTLLRNFYLEQPEDWAFFAAEIREHLAVMRSLLAQIRTNENPAAKNRANEAQLMALFRALHTVKGTAYMVGLTPLGDVAHRLEDTLAAVHEGERPFDARASCSLELGVAVLGAVLLQAEGQGALEETLMWLEPQPFIDAGTCEVGADVDEITSVAGQQSTPALHKDAYRVRLGVLFDRLAVFLRGRTDVHLQTHGAEIEVSAAVFTGFSDAALHLVRNVLAHAAQPQVHPSAGQAAALTLSLRAALTGRDLVLEVEDDGPGIDTAALRHAAVLQGLCSAEAAAALSETQALELIFVRGLSTALKVDAAAGRGVGLGAARAALRQLSGTLDVVTKPGRGGCFQLRIPR